MVRGNGRRKEVGESVHHELLEAAIIGVYRRRVGVSLVRLDDVPGVIPMLSNLINQHALADAQAGNWAAVAATLNAQTIEVRNAKSWTMADLIGLVGAEGASLVGGTIQAAGASNPIFAGAWIALNVTGLQLHTDERQQMIDGLAAVGGWPAELTTAVKAAGLTYTSLAGNAVTAEQCQLAWNRDTLAAQWVALQNDGGINVAVADGDRAALKAALAAAIEVL